jgi:hypothetical protein
MVIADVLSNFGQRDVVILLMVNDCDGADLAIDESIPTFSKQPTGISHFILFPRLCLDVS